MEEKEFQDPIVITGCDDSIRIAYDDTSVMIPRTGDIPEGTPALAARMFEAAVYKIGPGRIGL